MEVGRNKLDVVLETVVVDVVLETFATLLGNTISDVVM